MSTRSHPSRSSAGLLSVLACVVSFNVARPCLAQEAQPAPQAAPPAALDAPVAPAPAACSKIWIGHEAEYEEMLRTAPVVRNEKIQIGVLHPRRLYFGPGLPFESAAWKPVLPGTYAGFHESFGSEIAAYELDKLLGLHMVPPSVERKIGAQTGAVILWVENVKGWDMKAQIRGPDPVAWARELVRMKMFDHLIGNIDRNQGNLLYDAEYHLVLIDHSRAFIDTQDMTKFQKYLFVDRPLWQRMQALTIESVQPTLGKWVSKGMLLAMLERRDRMKREIDKMVSARGDNVWLR